MKKVLFSASLILLGYVLTKRMRKSRVKTLDESDHLFI